MRRLLLALTLLSVATTLPAQSSLTVGRAVRASLARGDTARYLVDADSGSVIRVAVDQLSTNVGVRVLGPQRNVLGGVNAAVRGPERLQVETRAKGMHQVQVIMVDSAPGDFAITLTAREALSTDPKKFVEQLLAPWDRRDGPGAAAAVWRGGRTLFAKGYGMANLTYDIPFTATTPTNIGSTSKQFTAFAVMLLVDDGKLSLDDNVRKYFPELPDFGTPVTVRSLLTHTSGYRDIFDALLMAARRIDEGDFVSRSEVIGLIQHQPSLQNAPGAEFIYNNSSYMLLSMLVERVAKRPFDEFMSQRVFGPIGMTHTVVRADRHATVRGATAGYTRAANGEWRDLGDLPSSIGAGGIYTTLGDLQKWTDNFAHPRTGSLQGIAQMMTPFTLTNGKSTGYGFGLFVDKQGSLKRIYHRGADLSHKSNLVYYPEIDAGVSVQSNDERFSPDLAFRIAEAFFPELTLRAAAPVAVFDVTSYDIKRFDQFAGRYTLDASPQFLFTFTRSGDSLMAQLTGQSANRIYPTSDSTFALRAVQASVTFHRSAEGKATGLTWSQGRDQKATRLVGEPVRPWVPTVAELAAFAGRYFSEELETFYDVSVMDGRLVLANRRTEPTTMVAGAKETFSAANRSNLTIVFERDRDGAVLAFNAGNPGARNIRFVRRPA